MLPLILYLTSSYTLGAVRLLSIAEPGDDLPSLFLVWLWSPLWAPLVIVSLVWLWACDIWSGGK